MPPTPPNPSKTGSFKIELVNMPYHDAQFIKGVIEILADPKRERDAQALRHGQASIYYTPSGRPAVDRP